MTLGEQRQRDTDREAHADELRRADRLRFRTDEPSRPVPPLPWQTRYRFFTSDEQIGSDPVVGPMMKEEKRRERNGLPPTFSLL